MKMNLQMVKLMNRNKMIFPNINMLQCLTGIILAGHVLLMAGSSPAFAGQKEVETLSVQDFLKKKPEWRKMKGTIRLEGRVSSIATTTMYLIKLDTAEKKIPFKIPESERPDKRPINVEVTGKLDFVSTHYVFTVEKFYSRPSDLDQYKKRASGLSDKDISKWFALAEEVRQRASFYEDDELFTLSDTYFLGAVRLSKKMIKEGDATGLRTLARKVQSSGKYPELVSAYLHESLRIEWDAIQKKPAHDYTNFIKLLKKELAGSIVPLKTLNSPDIKTYLVKPVESYQKASAENRLLYDRAFYREVVRKHVANNKNVDGSNAAKLAKLVSQLLPEDTPLLEELQEADLKYRIAGVSTSTRQVVTELAAELNRKSRNKQAKEVVLEWIKNREARTPKDQLVDRLDIANDYFKLLGDKTQAKRVLVATLKVYPGDKAILKKLKSMGYVEKSGAWILQNNASEEMPEDTALSPLAKGITFGMTREQVFSELGGPTSITRAVTRAGIIEIWDYNDAKLSITFQQNGPKEIAIVKKQSSTKMLPTVIAPK